ncbi:MAG: LysR family transcriptional regulator [Alphaproteobacteria bacterium]|nr:LysR family transcriptional regulator [Alphaproteobacteria bacterium]
MTTLDGMSSFVAVIDTGSFTKAAEQLGQTKSAISKHVTKLEERLGVKLINRTTRKLSLTDVGETYYEKARSIIEQAEEAEAEITSYQHAPRGKLRITIPISFGNTEIKKILPGFMEKYPEVELDLFLSDQVLDLFASNFELAIRVGEMKDSSLIARKIGTATNHVVASPDYWRQYGKPEKPEDLLAHNCMRYSNAPNPNIWSFYDKENKQHNVRIQGSFTCNNGEMEINVAKKGLAVCRVPIFLCHQALEAGELETALEDYNFSKLGIYAVYLPTRHVPAKIRAFIDYMAEHLLRN